MKKRKNSYTLLEILVAMGVFVIICIVVMRFFSGAQRVMVNTTNSNSLHADVRVAFDLIGRDLQSIVYNNKIGVEGIHPFAHSYYDYKNTPLNLTDAEIKIFYQDVIPSRLEKELSGANGMRDYAPLLCFISNQTDLPVAADFETCEIRYTFVPACIDEVTYRYQRSSKSRSSTIFSGGTLLRSCTFSDNRKTSLSDVNPKRHPHDFSAFPVVDSLGNAVPDAKNRIYQVFNDTNSNDNSSGAFERIIGGVYRMNISCFKLCSDGAIGKLKKLKMFDVNKPAEIPALRKEISTESESIYMQYSDWPLMSQVYPSNGATVELGQLGHPLPDMIKVDLYMLDSRSWNSFMNCYELSGSNFTIKSPAHREEAKKILNLKLRYFSKNFYITKIDASAL